MEKLSIREIQNGNELLAKIEDGIHPRVFLQTHVTDFVRNSLLGIDPPGVLANHLSAAMEDAKKIFDSFEGSYESRAKVNKNSYIDYLNKFQETFLFIQKPTIPELNELFEKSMSFIEAYT